MAEPIINEIDLASWLRKARRAPDPIAYLDRLNDQATDAVAAGDEYVTITTDPTPLNAKSRRASFSISRRCACNVSPLKRQPAAPTNSRPPTPSATSRFHEDLR